MKDHGAERSGSRKTAAEWLVELDSGRASEPREKAFEAWLGDAEHAAELERCEAALQIAARLAGDLQIVAAARAPRATLTIARMLVAPRTRLGFAALALLAVGALYLARGTARTPPGAAAASLAGTVVADISAEPVVLLPGRIPVDVRSVAVLPFALVSGDASHGTLVAQPDAGIAAEVHREVIAALGAVSGIYVVGRESVLPYSAFELLPAEIAVQLGVRGIVEGSVRLEGQRVRVTARLIDTATNAVLWQDTYERPATQLLSIETDVARSIASALAQPVETSVYDTLATSAPADAHDNPLIAARR